MGHITKYWIKKLGQGHPRLPTGPGAPKKLPALGWSPGKSWPRDHSTTAFFRQAPALGYDLARANTASLFIVIVWALSPLDFSPLAPQGDNTTPQPPLQTRQRSMLVTTRNHLFITILYQCAQDAIEERLPSQRKGITSCARLGGAGSKSTLCEVSAFPQHRRTQHADGPTNAKRTLKSANSC